VVFSYVRGNVALVPRRVLRPRRLVIAISPLLDAHFEKAVIDLAARRLRSRDPDPSPIRLVQDATSAVAQRRPGVSAMGARPIRPGLPPCTASGFTVSTGIPGSRLRRPGGIHPISTSQRGRLMLRLPPAILVVVLVGYPAPHRRPRQPS